MHSVIAFWCFPRWYCFWTLKQCALTHAPYLIFAWRLLSLITHCNIKLGCLISLQIYVRNCFCYAFKLNWNWIAPFTFIFFRHSLFLTLSLTCITSQCFNIQNLFAYNIWWFSTKFLLSYSLVYLALLKVLVLLPL